MTTRQLVYRDPIPYAPLGEFDALRQRDMAAERARRWARSQGYNSPQVESINRGPRNLVVRLWVEA